jgi:hypothetical protein
MVEGHVPQGVEVQVLSSAQVLDEKIPVEGIFCLNDYFSSETGKDSAYRGRIRLQQVTAPSAFASSETSTVLTL